MSTAREAPVEPTYKGQAGRTNGPLLCGCGALATHKAERFSPEGMYGTWVAEFICEAHGTALAASSDPPHRVLELSAWRSHSSARLKWLRESETAATLAAQQRWDI